MLQKKGFSFLQILARILAYPRMARILQLLDPGTRNNQKIFIFHGKFARQTLVKMRPKWIFRVQ